MSIICNKSHDNRMLQQCLSEYVDSYRSKLRLITTNSVSAAIEKDIWTLPVYKFVIPAEFDDNDEQTYKIIIDITESVPSFDTT